MVSHQHHSASTTRRRLFQVAAPLLLGSRAMEISITAFNKAERRLEMVLTGAPQPPEAFAVVHGDTTIARSMAVGPGQIIDGAVSIACEILADIATEMVLAAFSTARYEAQFAGGGRPKCS